MSTDPSVIARTAEDLLAAERDRTPIAPIHPRFDVDDIDAAYAVQERITAHALAGGRRIVGYKIGLTNPAVQRFLGVDQPDFGVLFDDMGYESGSTVPFGRVLQPRLEAEMAMVIGADLDAPDATVDDVKDAIQGVRAAFEIAGSRIADWKIGIIDTVADNASAGAFVLSERIVPLADVDLTGATMTMRRGDETVSTGVASSCMGNPVVAAHWLATELARRGTPLRKGHVVLTGSLGPVVAIGAGDVFHAVIDGLGEISVAFGP